MVGAWSYRQRGTPRAAVSGLTRRRPAGRVARYARRDHYASLRRRWPRSPPPSRTWDGGPGWSATTTPWSTGPPPIGPASVGSARTHCCCCRGWARGSCWARWSPTPPFGPPPPSVRPPHGEGCGSCSRCLTACPTGALVAPGVLDARRCLAWLVQAPGSFPEEYRRALGDRIYGCDECQQVCPDQPGRRPAGPTASRRTPASAPWVDLLELLEASDDELMAAHGRWYIAERDPRYLRRNALVALGNVGDGTDPGTERALRRWLSVDDPMLVEHARWAARRAGPARPGGRRPGDPPPGHQRLPAQGGGDPGLPVGAVAPARPRLLRRADRQVPPRRRGLRPGAGRSGASASSGSPSRVLVPGPRLVRRIRDTARRIGADLVVLDPVFPLGLVGPRLGHPLRRGAPRRRGGHPRPPARSAGSWSPTCCGTARWPSRPAAIRPPRPAGPCAGGAMPPVVEIPPGVDLDRFRPLSAATSGRRPGPTSASRPTDRWW